MPAVLPIPARVFWCERTPGVKSIQLSLTSADPAIDVTTATAARFEFTRDDGATWITWSATIAPDPADPTAILVDHVFIANDLDATMIDASKGVGLLDLNPIAVIASKDQPFDVRTLKVIL